MVEITQTQAERIFVASDTHFDHFGIINLCNRPFGNVKAMNYRLVRNWNDIVEPEDLTYHLGDVCYGRYCRPPLFWLNKLNGWKVMIRGSHDWRLPPQITHPHIILEVNGYKLLLIHNQLDAPPDFDGWIIHGHNHNSVPFIRWERKRMNVSVENTEYKPISLARIIEIIQNGNGKQ